VFLSIEQVGQIAQHCTKQVQAVIWAALLTGARRGELVKIRAEDIGPDTISLPSSHTKTLKARVIPIIPALRPWLVYFPTEVGVEGIKTAWQRARVKAGMEHVNFHDLRHSCASIMLGLGVDLYTISKILGHSTVQTTQRYSHLQVDAQRQALNKLSDLIEAGSKKKPEGVVLALNGRLVIARTTEEQREYTEERRKSRLIASNRAHASKQRVLRLLRQVAWADELAIKEMYKLAAWLGVKTGIPHEVDHVIPLIGKTVSGLHVENNLKVITRDENRKKSNRYEIEMMEYANAED
jgi:integrase